MSEKEKRVDSLNKKIENIEIAKAKFVNNEHRFIFLVPDLRGQARSSNINIYEHAMALKRMGRSVIMLHEKEDYLMPNSWFNNEAGELEHISIESRKLMISASDILIVPDVMSNVLEQTENSTYYRVVFVQGHDKMLTPMPPGKAYTDYGVREAIVTNSTLKNIVNDLMEPINITQVSNYVRDEFSPSKAPKKPTVAIYSNDDKSVTKIIKQFYLRFPLLKWISFKHMIGIPQENYAKNLKESALAVWVDPQASFGRFPLEAINCGVPVIGKIPDFPCEWMNDENGIWVENEYDIPQLVASYMKNWIEGTLEEFQNPEKTVEGLFTKESFESDLTNAYELIKERRLIELNGYLERAAEEMKKIQEMNEDDFVVPEDNNQTSNIR